MNIAESDVVPVPGGALPTRVFKHRQDQSRFYGRRTSAVNRMLGEASEDEGIIPDDAEPIASTGALTDRSGVKPVKDVVQEPSYPYGEKEKLISPVAALTAPDATPDAFKPLDPSLVPSAKTAQVFTVKELGQSNGIGQDQAVTVMDTILGRSRQPSVPGQQTAPITTESAARAALGIQASFSPGFSAKSGAELLREGQQMAPPKVADSKTVCDVLRRFV